MLKKIWYSALLRNVRVLFIGEYFHDDKLRNKLAKLVPTLKRCGVDAIGLEMYRDKQHLVDIYLKTGRNRKELEELLEESWGFFYFSGKLVEATRNLIDIARKNDIEIFLFDITEKDYGKYAKEKEQKDAERWRTAEMAKVIIENAKVHNKIVVLVGRGHLESWYCEKPLQVLLKEAKIKNRKRIWKA